MTAGRGIVHAEMPGTDTIEGMQLWLNLKREDKMCDPKYQDLLGDRIPKAEDNGAHVAIIAGSAMGQTAETITKTPALYIDVTLDPGASFV
jgi:redox-sensitive bicupin YhaK (pirin superfamily)